MGRTDPLRMAYEPVANTTRPTSGVTVAAAGLAGVVGTLALMLLLMALSFAAFFLLGLPAVLGVMTASVLWGIQFGFGGAAPLEGWLVGPTGFPPAALAPHTGAALPIYWPLGFGSGPRVDRPRAAGV